MSFLWWMCWGGGGSLVGVPGSRLYEAVISSAIKPSNPICMWLDYFTVTAFIFPSLTQLPYKSTGIHSIHPVANNSFPSAVSHTAYRTVLDNITCSNALWHYGALSALCAQQIYVPAGNCHTLLFKAATIFVSQLNEAANVQASRMKWRHGIVKWRCIYQSFCQKKLSLFHQDDHLIPWIFYSRDNKFYFTFMENVNVSARHHNSLFHLHFEQVLRIFKFRCRMQCNASIDCVSTSDATNSFNV